MSGQTPHLCWCVRGGLFHRSLPGPLFASFPHGLHTFPDGMFHHRALLPSPRPAAHPRQGLKLPLSPRPPPSQGPAGAPPSSPSPLRRHALFVQLPPLPPVDAIFAKTSPCLLAQDVFCHTNTSNAMTSKERCWLKAQPRTPTQLVGLVCWIPCAPEWSKDAFRLAAWPISAAEKGPMRHTPNEPVNSS